MHNLIIDNKHNQLIQGGAMEATMIVRALDNKEYPVDVSEEAWPNPIITLSEQVYNKTLSTIHPLIVGILLESGAAVWVEVFAVNDSLKGNEGLIDLFTQDISRLAGLWY